MADLDLAGSIVVKGGLETFIPDLHAGPTKEGHDGALAHTGISDHEDSLGGLGIIGNGFKAIVDHAFELAEVDGTGITVLLRHLNSIIILRAY